MSKELTLARLARLYVRIASNTYREVKNRRLSTATLKVQGSRKPRIEDSYNNHALLTTRQVTQMPSPHIPDLIHIDLKSKRRNPLSRLREEIPNSAEHIPQIVISHRLAALSEIGHIDRDVVSFGHDVRVAEEAVANEISASAIENDCEDEAEGEAEGLEQERGWEFDAEAVEEEGHGGAIDAIGD